MSPADLQFWANWASIATLLVASVGVFSYLWQLWRRRRKRIALEDYLRDEKRKGADKGQRSILRIMRDVALSEDEIIQASFNSNRIQRLVREDADTGLASDLLFESKD